MRNLHLDQLRAFVDVAELGSFSAAARRLNLSQPAVSLQVREFEARLGVRLIDRVGKRAEPSTAGRDLIEHARRIFDACDGASAAMRRHKDGRVARVRIGSGSAGLTYLLPPVLQRLHASHPEIELGCSAGSGSGLTQGLLDDELDIGFVTLPVDEREFEVTRVRDDAMMAILPARHADAPAAMTPADVAAHPLILEYEVSNHSRLSRQWLRAGGVEARPVMSLNNLEAIKSVVAAGLGVSIVPTLCLGRGADGLVVRPLDPPLKRTLALIRRRKRRDDPAAQTVWDALLALAAPPYAKAAARPRAGRR